MDSSESNHVLDVLRATLLLVESSTELK
jgi:hypothetical protein